MKRICMLVGLCLCLLGLAACGQSGADTSLPAMTNTETKTSIALGMTREEMKDVVEQTFNTPWLDEETGSGSMMYGETGEERITVLYENNQVTGMMVDSAISDAETSHWALPGGITKGSTLDQITKAYGENPEANDQSTLFTYTFPEEGYAIDLLVTENGLEAYTLTQLAEEG